jgi:hypothetical protein
MITQGRPAPPRLVGDRLEVLGQEVPYRCDPIIRLRRAAGD